jgi:hypothetical protein
MGCVMLLLGLLIPCLCGIGVLLLLRPPGDSLSAPGEVAWLLGAGSLAGTFLLTLWMRLLSLAHVRFSVVAIALPLLAIAVAMGCLVWRRYGRTTLSASSAAARALISSPGLVGAARVLWWLCLGWMAIRFALLALEVTWRPLYPWDAWIQWATKAKVWFELGSIVPFARSEEWYAAGGSVYFDASPEYPPTMPLMQVWACLLLGRWDDALMNWPWWQTAVALGLLVYGGMRRLECAPLEALAASFLTSSLPLANVHVALAGYADLPMAAYYTVAALALLRWSMTREMRDGVLSGCFALACTQIKNPGYAWAITLLPGAIIAVSPKRGLRLIAAVVGVAILAIVALAFTHTRVFEYEIHLNFDLDWKALIDSYFVLGNWHLLWYGMLGAAVLAGRRLLAPPLAPLTTTIAAGLSFLVFVLAFTSARDFSTEQTTINRATLHMAPLMVVFAVMAFREFSRRWNEGSPRKIGSGPIRQQ